MEFRGDIPIYLQVCNKIKKDIVNKIISPGGKLPSTRELALELAINPNTAARVYRELESEGLTFTLRGRGTFVTDDLKRLTGIKEELAKTAVEGFLQEMYEMRMTNDEIVEILKKEMLETKEARNE